MRRIAGVLLLFTLLLVTPAEANWRWPKPHYKLQKAKAFCDMPQCVKAAHRRAHALRKARVQFYNHRKQAEWDYWTSLYIPSCTWLGESGAGPEFARFRYTVPNKDNSGAYGKYQFMPQTYASNAKYNDWSALDQEIAAHRLFWQAGTAPWSNPSC